MNVGENISCSKKFDFQHGVANGFANHVRSSVPLYETMHQMIIDMTEHFINYNDKENNYFLDIGCSNGDLVKGITSKYNDSIYVFGVDNSKEMIDLAKKQYENLGLRPSLCYECLDITEDESWHYKDNIFNVISMVLTLQFIPLHKRLDVLKNAYKKIETWRSVYDD